jgi:hypothetical protein
MALRLNELYTIKVPFNILARAQPTYGLQGATEYGTHLLYLMVSLSAITLIGKKSIYLQPFTPDM